MRSLRNSTPTYPRAHTHTQDDILRRGNIDQVLEEKRILQTVNHPFIVSLHFAFQVRRENERARKRERERERERERDWGGEGGGGGGRKAHKSESTHSLTSLHTCHVA
jgi:hypothetical protein